MVNCLPEPGVLSASLFAAPMLLVRGLRRRAAHWIIIHHQRYLQKLSVRRRRHKSLGNRPSRSCSEPLVVRESHRIEGKIRPYSEPPIPSSLLEDSEEDDHVTDEVELEVHVSVIHVPVRPLVVLSRSFSWARVPPLPPPLKLSEKPQAIPVSTSELSYKTSSLEDQAPSEFLSPLPCKDSSYMCLEDGETILFGPLHRQMLKKPYFHLVSRSKAKDLVDDGEVGMFLIRPSTHSGDPLSITIKLDRVYNVSIRQRPDYLFALGTKKTCERTFSSIDEIVDTFSKEPLQMKDGQRVVLTCFPSKEEF